MTGKSQRSVLKMMRDAIVRHLAPGRSAIRRGSNYTTKLTWLFRRAVEGQRLRVVGVLALGQLSFAGQAAALGVLSWGLSGFPKDIWLDAMT